MAFLSKLPFTISALLILWIITVSSVPNTNITSVLCNTGTYTSGDPFTISLAYVLSDLLDATPSRKGHDYYNISPFPNAFAYGHAACMANLTNGDCSVCLQSAEGAMNSTCGMAIEQYMQTLFQGHLLLITLQPVGFLLDVACFLY
ncbi:antifungal protein ginkbilobin-like protein [Elaeis guineensis]|uniref:antifungal protein ginkbilobin-like protein n=1 Tax=Elaeis guineensis var. tenera TaxID=51953 RepID=UPI003C6D314F